MLGDIEDRADVGMAKCGSGAGFAIETFQDAGTIILSDVGDFEGDLAVEFRVQGKEDSAHAALTQLLEDTVAAQFFRDLSLLLAHHGGLNLGGGFVGGCMTSLAAERRGR